MIMNARPKGGALGALCLAVICGIAVTPGCRQYVDRVDTVNLGGGDAIAHNKAVHTIDPWPPEAFKKRHHTKSTRVLNATKHYDEGPPKPKDAKKIQNQTQ